MSLITVMISYCFPCNVPESPSLYCVLVPTSSSMSPCKAETLKHVIENAMYESTMWHPFLESKPDFRYKETIILQQRPS